MGGAPCGGVVEAGPATVTGGAGMVRELLMISRALSQSWGAIDRALSCDIPWLKSSCAAREWIVGVSPPSGNSEASCVARDSLTA